jgi:hypothetical protein
MVRAGRVPALVLEVLRDALEPLSDSALGMCRRWECEGRAAAVDSKPVVRRRNIPSPQGFAFSETETFPRAPEDFQTVSQRAEPKHLAENCSLSAATYVFYSCRLSLFTEAKQFLAEVETIEGFGFVQSETKTSGG